MGRLVDTFGRYLKKNSSSLAFWWLPLYEGSGQYELEEKHAKDYYLDFTAKAQYTHLFDDRGVILLDYKGNIGIQYNPCAIAQYGLGLYATYLKTNNKLLEKKMIIQADWLCENTKVDKHGIGRIEYTFGTGDYKQITNANYISAIAQGQAVSFLLRVGIKLKVERYIETAKKIYQCFRYDIKNGGVVNFDERGRMYLEEAVTEKISCILDGFIYAMFGVYDYYQYTQEKEAKDIFDKCCQTVQERLPEFDLGFWSRADCYLEKPKMPASKFYHNVHVQQLRALYTITNNDIFLKYANKWDGYQQNVLYRSMALVYKCWFKIFYY